MAMSGAAAAAGSNVDHLHVLTLSTRDPGAATGLSLSVSQSPTPSGQQPPVVRRLTITLPLGARIHNAQVASCAADDVTLKAKGAGACPAATRLGTGTASVFLGGAQPLLGQVVLLHRHSGFVFVLSAGTTVLRILDATAGGRAIHVTLPRVPLAGGKEASFLSLKVTIPARTSAGRAWITAPTRCPKDRRWSLDYALTFDAPIGTEQLTATSPCRRVT